MNISNFIFLNFRTSIPHSVLRMKVTFVKSMLVTKVQNPCRSKGFRSSAREESRTPTDFTPQASETCASTNFATRAEVELFRDTHQHYRLV